MDIPRIEFLMRQGKQQLTMLKNPNCKSTFFSWFYFGFLETSAVKIKLKSNFKTLSGIAGTEKRLNKVKH
eukprot:Pgem_evm1s18700